MTLPLVLLICGAGWRERRQAIERPTKKFQLGEGWLCASAQSGLSTPIRTTTFILVALKYAVQECDTDKRCFWNCWPKIWDLCRIVRWHAVCLKVWKWKPSYIFEIFWDLNPKSEIGMIDKNPKSLAFWLLQFKGALEILHCRIFPQGGYIPYTAYATYFHCLLCLHSFRSKWDIMPLDRLDGLGTAYRLLWLQKHLRH